MSRVIKDISTSRHSMEKTAGMSKKMRKSSKQAGRKDKLSINSSPHQATTEVGRQWNNIFRVLSDSQTRILRKVRFSVKS